MLIIKQAQFVISSTDYKKGPKDGKPEFAFIGRSNVGKSSLINMLTGNKKLAKTSGTPGKTRLINHFIINEQWYLVDLPGYGFARASKKDRASWEKFIVDYLTKSESLVNLFVLVDSRLEPQKIDIEFINWCGEKQIPFSIIFTKLDKLSGSEYARNLTRYKKELSKTWASIPPVFGTSSASSHGRESVLNYIEDILKSIST
jgi:GTP-binding protein